MVILRVEGVGSGTDHIHPDERMKRRETDKNPESTGDPDRSGYHGSMDVASP
jgi:hypothetical protein